MRILTAIVLCTGIVGPFSMATAFAQNAVAQNAPQTSGSITGSIRDANGAPVSGASVTVSGPQTQTTTTDAQGNFSISNLKPGIYSFRSSRTGYNTATESNITVVAGGTQTLAVVMSALTFSSLRTIATVRSVGRGTFNTTPASVSIVNSQTFTDQGQPQVMRVLNEQPGAVASYPQTSANGAVPGAITFPNIRGALSFETASLIDGHPVSVGTYGDYVTSFMNSFALGGLEVVKGPGADSPEVNYAIGGTVNFLTKNPTFTPSGNYTLSYGSHGSAIENFAVSDTVGRLGFVLDYASNYDPSPVQNYSAWFVPGGANTYLNYNQATQSGTYVGYNDSQTAIPGTASANYNSFGTVACCYSLSGTYESRGELAKLTYKLSNATRATFSYLGSQAFADQNGNTSSQTPGTFAPGAKYSGSLTAGSPILITNLHPGGSDQEINNEPILQGDIRTTIGNDTILARYYHASIWRLIHEGPDAPYIPDSMLLNVQGTNGQKPTSANISGFQPVTFFDYYQQAEIDKLGGFSLQYSHPIGENNLFTFTADNNQSTTVSYSASPSMPFNGPFNANTVGLSYSVNLPQGSKQTFGTYLAKFNFHPTSKIGITWSNYYNTYNSTYPVACNKVVIGVNPAQCYPDGTGYVFGTTTRNHYDPRLAFEFRPNANAAVRLSFGSAIAPPYLNILSALNGNVNYTNGNQYATQTVNAGTLSPETAFGFDFGGDFRILDGVTTASFDVYRTNLFNHFIQQVYNSGLTCNTAPCPAGGVPLYYSSWTNLNNSRFDGLELQVRRNPAVGLGFNGALSLMRGYVYNLPPCFYSKTPSNCSALQQNLAIVPNVNFTGGGMGPIFGGPFSGQSFNGFSNQNIPYLTAFTQLSYRFPGGMYAQVGETFMGKNNSLNEPPFAILNASLRAPIANGLSLEVAGDNLTNQYSGLFPIQGAGVPIPLANGASAATYANVLGPSTIRVMLIKNFGEGANPTP